ncbi:hypothetical protein Tco_0924277 [Tanacetum coccineum]|uniref:Uncharacterized protein n=1 Tax=Tanacetum coccineum TaxID=301880 RepID=A0ABQ5D5L4_9ASTR
MTKEYPFFKKSTQGRDLLKKYEVSDSFLVKTSIVPPNNLGPDLAGKPVNETLYRGMIGSLMYLTATRPDNLSESFIAEQLELQNSQNVYVQDINPIQKNHISMLKAPQVPVNCVEANWFVGVQRKNSQWLCPLPRLMTPLPCSKKKRKNKTQTVTQPQPKSQGPEASRVVKDNWEKHEEVVTSYADLKWSIEDFHTTTFKNYENTDASLRNYEKILDKFRTDHVTELNKIFNNLQEVQNVVKEDPSLNKKVLEAAETYTKNSINLTGLLVKNFDFPSTSKIKAMMTRIFCAFKGQSFSTPLSSVTKLTLVIIGVQGTKDDMITEETVSNTVDVEKEPVQETQDTEPIPITIVRPTVTLETKIIGSSSRPQLTYPIVEVQLVKASTKVCPDPDTPVLIPFEINGKLYHLTNEQIQAHMEMEERKEKADQEARLLVLNKSELIKVIHEVAIEVGVDPKDLQSSEGGQEFIKKQDVELKALKRERLEKLSKAKELRKKGLINIDRLPPADASLKKSFIFSFIQTQTCCNHSLQRQ